MSRHIVIAWEIGAGFGHLRPIYALTETLLMRGHRVTVIIPSASQGRSVFAPLGLDVIEMPPISAPARAHPISLNFTANLLRNGLWHAETLKKRLSAWQSLLKQLKPDLLLCDSAPVALLASRSSQYPRVAMGTGFALPPLLNPMPSLQPWFTISTDALAKIDREFLQVVNPVLAEANLPPLNTVASLFDGVERLLTIEPELDHYAIRASDTYWGTIEPKAMVSVAGFFTWPKEPGVFIFMDASNRFLPAILQVLKIRGIPVVAVISNLKTSALHLAQGDNIHYLTTFIDLAQAAAWSRLIITHGGTRSTAAIVKQGANLLLFPSDLEKAIFAQRLVERQLAHSANWFSAKVSVAALIDQALTSNPTQLSSFAKKYADTSPAHNVEKIVTKIENLLI